MSPSTLSCCYVSNDARLEHVGARLTGFPCRSIAVAPSYQDQHQTKKYGPRPFVILATDNSLAALAVIFSVGLVPLIASGMRLYEIVMAGTSKGATWLEGDISWNWAWVPAWSQIEVDVGIVAASLPSLSPLLKRMWSGFAIDRPKTPSQMPTLLDSALKLAQPDDLSTWDGDCKDLNEYRASIGEDCNTKEGGCEAIVGSVSFEELQTGRDCRRRSLIK